MAKKPQSSGLNNIINWGMLTLLSVAFIASIIGIYKTHMVGQGATFGTTTGSLSLIAFAFVSHFWLQSLKGCCCGCKDCTC